MDNIKEKYTEYFGSRPAEVFSAPGRVELGGNHTDHQNGVVLAAAIDLKAYAAAAPCPGSLFTLYSRGHGKTVADLSDLSQRDDERETSAGLIRGIAAALLASKDAPAADRRGINMYMISTVPVGSGLSSSAAFELAVARTMNGLWGLGKTGEELAMAGQYAENEYFKKPSGLMDQMTGALESAVFIDFKDPEKPGVKKISYDFSSAPWDLIIIDCGADHSKMTGLYASIPNELASVSAFFGKKVLRDVPEEEFMKALPKLREECADRALLRAFHVYGENKRCLKEYEALEEGRFTDFLALVNESGSSSWRLLQNIVPEGDPLRQDMAFALAAAERLLDGKGACRVMGGGFAGTLQAFVPREMTEDFIKEIERILKKGCCRRVTLLCQGR